MHLEFVVLGPPISNQSPGGTLQSWRSKVRAAAQDRWDRPPLRGDLKGIIINFYGGDKPPLDVDNMSKPILDVLQALVYDDDRQIHQAEVAHVRIDAPFVFVGVSRLIASSVQAGEEFVYVRIEDAREPFPLPRESS